MKKIAIILLTGLSLLLSLNTAIADGRKKVEKVDGGTWVHYYIDGVDSLETFTFDPFDATGAIKYLMQYQSPKNLQDTLRAYHIEQGYIFVNVVTSAGTSVIDSMTYLYLQGAMSDGVYHTFDTLKTAKTNPIRKQILYYTQPLYPFWQVIGKCAGGTAIKIWIDIFIPGTFPGGGGSPPIPMEGQKHPQEYFIKHQSGNEGRLK